MVFTVAKLVWLVVSPGNLLVLLLVAGTGAALAPWRAVRRLGRGLIGAAVVLALALALLPLEAWLLAPLENRFARPEPLPERVDGIVALGGAIDLRASAARGEAQLNGAAERLTALADLARRYPAAKLVFTGGSGLLGTQVAREADFARPLLAGLGVEPARLIVERDSRNTRENAINAWHAAEPRPGETWLLITSAAHMPRAVGAFRLIGWQIEAYPVDYHAAQATFVPDFATGLNAASLGLQEWLGLSAYRLLGWTDSWLPAPRRARARG